MGGQRKRPGQDKHRQPELHSGGRGDGDGPACGQKSDLRR